MEQRDWCNQGRDFQTGIAGLPYLVIIKSCISENTRPSLCPGWTTCSIYILLFNLYCFFFLNNKGNSGHSREYILQMAVILTLKLKYKMGSLDKKETV